MGAGSAPDSYHIQGKDMKVYICSECKKETVYKGNDDTIIFKEGITIPICEECSAKLFPYDRPIRPSFLKKLEELTEYDGYVENKPYLQNSQTTIWPEGLPQSGIPLTLNEKVKKS